MLDTVMYSVTTSYFSNLIVQKVNKVLVYTTDLTATLNLGHFDLHCFLVYIIIHGKNREFLVKVT